MRICSTTKTCVINNVKRPSKLGVDTNSFANMGTTAIVHVSSTSAIIQHTELERQGVVKTGTRSREQSSTRNTLHAYPQFRPLEYS